jgi:hypothetical protein
MQVVRAGSPAEISANDRVLKRISCADGAVWGENADGRFDLSAGDDVLVDKYTTLFSLTYASVQVVEVDGLAERLRRLEEQSAE